MRLFRSFKNTTPDAITIDNDFYHDTARKRKELADFTLADFETKETLGTGSFGRVRLCKHTKTGRVYAVKMLSKQLVVRTKQVDHIMAEKDILTCISHPFIINMYGVSQDETYLFFVLEYSIGGELFSHLRRATRFSNETAMFYSASVALIFEYLHNRHIVYRDLKPENLLLDAHGRLKMCDFGFAKTVEPGTNTWTLCGTPEYLAPEIILNKGHGKAVDWWTFGILTFEMLAGFPPFYADDRMALYKAILGGKIDWPKHFKSSARDIIGGSLHADLSKRLGNLKDGAKDIRKHAWFSKFDFQALANGKLEAPISIKARGDEDASNFDDYPDNEGPDIGVGKIKPEQQELFHGFVMDEAASRMLSPEPQAKSPIGRTASSGLSKSLSSRFGTSTSRTPSA